MILAVTTKVTTSFNFDLFPIYSCGFVPPSVSYCPYPFPTSEFVSTLMGGVWTIAGTSGIVAVGYNESYQRVELLDCPEGHQKTCFRSIFE